MGRLTNVELRNVRMGRMVVVVQHFDNKPDVAHVGEVFDTTDDYVTFMDGRSINVHPHVGMPDVSFYLVSR